MKKFESAEIEIIVLDLNDAITCSFTVDNTNKETPVDTLGAVDPTTPVV